MRADITFAPLGEVSENLDGSGVACDRVVHDVGRNDAVLPKHPLRLFLGRDGCNRTAIPGERTAPVELLLRIDHHAEARRPRG